SPSSSSPLRGVGSTTRETRRDEGTTAARKGAWRMTTEMSDTVRPGATRTSNAAETYIEYEAPASAVWKRWTQRVIIHLFLLFVAVVSLLPLVYMVSTSLKERGREFTYPIEWIPNPLVWANYRTALE